MPWAFYNYTAHFYFTFRKKENNTVSSHSHYAMQQK